MKRKHRRITAIMVVVILVVGGTYVADRWWTLGETSVDRVTSPCGRYDVVWIRSKVFLDVYTELWITEAGETNRFWWHRIAPKIDGTWCAEWWSSTHLVLTAPLHHFVDHLGTEPWQDVRIETRAPPSGPDYLAPDHRHEVSTWTWNDSRGRRTGARLTTTWENQGPSASCDLVAEGPWYIAVEWLAHDRLVVRVTPHGDRSIPPRDFRFGKVSVSVEVTGLGHREGG